MLVKVQFECTKPTKKTIIVLIVVFALCITTCVLSLYQTHVYSAEIDMLANKIIHYQNTNQETKHDIETINNVDTMLKIANKHGFVDKDTIVFTNLEGEICVIYTPQLP